MTLAERLAQARRHLVAAGIHEADATVDVDVYAREILAWDRAKLLSELRAPVPAHLEPQLSDWIARRSLGEPTAYIVGTREFWNLPFRVTSSVLIPRPETEIIVDEALQSLRTARSARVADIGTGSGCIAVSIAHALAAVSVIATDISEEALAVAQSNAVTHGVAGRVSFMRASYLDGVDGPFDLVTANPPYVRSGDKAGLGRDVRHEPEVALFGGVDGLQHIVGVLDAAIRVLIPGGRLLMEFGYGQEESVRALVDARAQLHLNSVRNDLQGIARTAVVSRI